MKKNCIFWMFAMLMMWVRGLWAIENKKQRHSPKVIIPILKKLGLVKLQ